MKNTQWINQTCKMNLEKMCLNALIENIQHLPPLLLEKVILQSVQAIKEKEKKKLIEELKISACAVTEDITELLIKSHKTGRDWNRPLYTNRLDEDLYQTLVQVSEGFVNNYIEELLHEVL